MKKYNYQINGLRAILCILIVLFHFFIRHSGVEVGQFFPNASVVWGAFLVLSGYFISYSNGKYYWRSKILNTIIPYIISVILIFSVSLCALKSEYTVSVKDLAMNILSLPMLTAAFNYVDGAHWYIIYLIYFYYVFFIFNIISRKNKKVLDFLMGAFGVLCVISIFISADMGFFAKVFRTAFTSRLIFLIMGYFWKSGKEKSDIIKRIVSFACAELYFINGEAINCLYFLIIVLIFILCEKEKPKFLNTPLFQIVGTNSLFIYLIHQNIGYLIIDSCENYWIGAILATINAIAIGIIFGTAYKKILNYYKSKKAVSQK